MNIGDSIRFRYTGERGQINKDYLDGSYKVKLNSGEEIVAFSEDIILASQFKGVESSPVSTIKNKKNISTEEIYFGKGKSFQEIEPTKPSPKLENTVFSPLAKHKNCNSGMHLIFVPTPTEEYQIFFLNDSPLSQNIHFKIFHEERIIESIKTKVEAFDFSILYQISRNHLNKSYNFQLETNQIPLLNKWKINESQLIQKKKMIGFFNTECIAISLDQEKRTSELDLRNYTMHNLRQNKNQNQKIPSNKLVHHARFKAEIDLHIEKLDPLGKVEAKNILSYQLDQLRQHLSECRNQNVKQTIVIHGIGLGILQKAVEEVLEDMQMRGMISSFKNEFISGYGFGATQVLF